MCRILVVVSIVTKIRILKQITTATEWHDASESCIYSNKDKNFKANHNIYWCKVDGFIVVSIVTKIRILKQITTMTFCVSLSGGCIYSNKDKNFKANHNLGLWLSRLIQVVSIVTKIRILKQITTCVPLDISLTGLYL